MDNEFPPNSNADREQRRDRPADKGRPEKKEVVRITKGKAIMRKKPLRRKFFEAFRPEDNVGFAEHILLEVLVPSIKDAIAFASTEAIETALGTNGGRGRRRERRGGGGYTSYNRMSKPDRDDRRDDRRGGSRREVPTRSSDLREVILDSRVEAEEVLDTLIELVSKYDVATVRDLMGLIGENHKTTDEDWGWLDLRGSRIHRLGMDSFLLDLPRPEFLD